jgi:hypothetical protein
MVSGGSRTQLDGDETDDGGDDNNNINHKGATLSTAQPDGCLVKLLQPKGKLPRRFLNSAAGVPCSIRLVADGPMSSITFFPLPSSATDGPASPPQLPADKAQNQLAVALKYVTRFRPMPNPSSKVFAASVAFMTPTASGTLSLNWGAKEDRNDFLVHLKAACGPNAAASVA